MAGSDRPQALDPARREVAILGNLSAGRRGARPEVAELEAALRRYGFTPILCWQREEIARLATEVRCVVAAGGDGTLAEVVNRVPSVPVTLLPVGNENLVARHFGIDPSAVRVAQTVDAGYIRTLDLLRVGDRLASLMAGIGFDAEVVHGVGRARQGNINRLTYVGPILDALRSYAFPRIEVEVAETGERLGGAMVFAFNLPCYGLGLPIAPEARADDGLLDLYVFDRPGRWNLARYVWAVLSGRRDRLPDFQHRRARQVRLAAKERVPAQSDGDPAGELPLTIEVVPGALPLIVPPDVG
jgi:diacylglycerol kinase family enzyme